MEIKCSQYSVAVEKKILPDEKKLESPCAGVEIANSLVEKQERLPRSAAFRTLKEVNYAAAGASSGAPAT